VNGNAAKVRVAAALPYIAYSAPFIKKWNFIKKWKPSLCVAASCHLVKLRRGMAQLCLQGIVLGHDTRALQHYLGHRNIQHTVRYTEMAPDRFKNFWR